MALAEGKFGPFSSKTANACIRYSPERVVAVLDSTRAGQTAQDVLGFGGAIPVMAAFEDAVALSPTALLIGIAPQGGGLPEAWRATVRAAMESGLDLWSGLHFFVGDDPEFGPLASARGVRIFDLRRPPKNIPVASGRLRDMKATVILAVGTDCNVGKMTAMLQVRDELRRKGNRVAFGATGQTGILVEGRGVPVDAVVADFIAGAAEQLVLECAEDSDIVLVEGQGSLVHPGYSGVTLGLMHGSYPHALVLCAQPSRKTIINNDWLPTPSLSHMIALHDMVTKALRPAPTIAVALNTFDLSERDASAAIAAAEKETGLPCADPVRYDARPIVEAIEAFHGLRE